MTPSTKYRLYGACCRSLSGAALRRRIRSLSTVGINIGESRRSTSRTDRGRGPSERPHSWTQYLPGKPTYLRTCRADHGLLIRVVAALAPTTYGAVARASSGWRLALWVPQGFCRLRAVTCRRPSGIGGGDAPLIQPSRQRGVVDQPTTGVSAAGCHGVGRRLGPEAAPRGLRREPLR